MSRKAGLILTQLNSTSLMQEYLNSTNSEPIEMTSIGSPSSPYQLPIDCKPKIVKVNLQELENEIKELESENLNQISITRKKLMADINKRSAFAMSVLERNSFWANKKQEKLESKRKEKVDRELDGCTFRPKVNPTKPSNSLNSSMSMPKERTYAQINKAKARLRSTPRGSALSYKVIHSKF